MDADAECCRYFYRLSGDDTGDRPRSHTAEVLIQNRCQIACHRDARYPVLLLIL